MTMFSRMLGATVLMAAIVAASLPARAMERVTVYGAASTQPVIDALIPAMKQRGVAVRAVYAGSSTLARQIELGAPDVDIFLSANPRWMDYLDGLGLLKPGTRRAVATNRLVVIAAADVPISASLVFKDGSAIERALDDGRIAIANSDAVPAGIYAKEALQSISAWDGLKDRLAPTKDVTGALMLVVRGEARLGIVYQSDTTRVEGLRIFGIFPADSHSPIVYQAAVLKGRDGQATRAFLDVLTDAQGQAAFQASGFGAKP